MRSSRTTDDRSADFGTAALIPDVSAIVPAAGLGKRFGSGVRKQYIELGGRPVISWVLDALQAHPGIRDIVIVVRQEDMDLCTRIISEGGYTKAVSPVIGGAERQDSVYNGLQSLKDSPPSLVLVHDGVRPFLSEALITACMHGVAGHDGAIAAVPPKDTIKQGVTDPSLSGVIDPSPSGATAPSGVIDPSLSGVTDPSPSGATDPSGVTAPSGVIDPPVIVVERTLDRSTLWSVQTPQVFPFEILMRAYEAASAKGFYSTDDSALVEAMGGSVRIVPGYYENIKVTTPEDLAVADAIIKRGRSL